MTDTAEAGSVAAEQPAGNPAQATETVDNGSATESAKSWLDGLSEGNRKLAETKGWTTDDAPEKVLSSYAELERKVGDNLKVPAPDAPKEEWDKFHAKLPEDMDFNAGTVVEGRSVQEVGRELFLRLLATASGEPTCSERLGLGDEEFVPWQVGPVL